MAEGPLLVSGAAGCIGAWIVSRLSQAGREVVALDRSDDRRRLRLAMDEEAARAVPWLNVDISDATALDDAVMRLRPAVIIHLAALQIPFCAADPVAGATVNVAGHAALFEAARKAGVRHVVYASSVASLPAAGRQGPNTLYGVYKRANEGVAAIYWQDWQVASIGVRPHTVYGPGRDQGMTSSPTKAMLAAASGQPYQIAYDTTMMMQHVHEVADAFITCADATVSGHHVCNLGGVKATTRDMAAIINRIVPGARISVADTRIDLPVDQDDRALRALVGDWPAVSLENGIHHTICAFRDLAGRGLATP